MSHETLTEHTKLSTAENNSLLATNDNVKQQHYAHIKQQRKLFLKIVESSNINITTCGRCEDVVLHKIKHEGDIVCPHCLFASDGCDFPDFYY